MDNKYHSNIKGSIDIKYRVSKTKNQLLKFNRLLNENIPKKEYYSLKNNELNLVSCHLGQRKLLLSEIEFLSIVAKNNNLNNYLVVYIGAAAGYHFPVLHKLFPEVKFLLIDPNPFYSKLREQPDVYIIINDYFTDDSIKQVLKIAKGKKILLISDIRVEPEESKVIKDMHNQQKWLINMDAEYYMLKFRMPYIQRDGTYINEDFDISEFKDKFDKIKIKKQNDEFQSLSGDLYIQLYPPRRSSETRLIGSKNKNGKYELTTFNITDYDQRLNYYNHFIRNSPNYFEDSQKLKEHLLGYDDGYDVVGEYYIMHHYVKYYLKKEPSLKKIINLLYEMNVIMFDIHRKYILDCLFTRGLEKDQENRFNEEIMSMPAILNYQIQLIKKSTILSEYQNKKMIKIVWKSTPILNYNNDKGFSFKRNPKMLIRE
jgi:hypothetical protein